jgi:2-methylisocitrate lyase-like PEP mutase family enzyme
MQASGVASVTCSLPQRQQRFTMAPMANTRVQTILDEVGSIVFPGVYDTLSARIAQNIGFRMAFISGYSVAASAIGEPDMGLLTQTEMLERARRVCGAVDIPIIVDADTGYGNPLNVYRTVKDLMDAGAAGCFLEDQVWPKKCGHMRGKKVIERSEYIHKIRAAVDARGDADFFIVARTDALAAVSLQEAIARVTEARQVGADASFVEAPNSIEDLAEVGRCAPKPIVANMIEKGLTPLLAKEELDKMGFALILYPLSALFSAAKAISDIYQKMYDDNTTDGAIDQLMPFDQFNELIGVEEKYKMARKYGIE